MTTPATPNSQALPTGEFLRRLEAAVAERGWVVERIEGGVRFRLDVADFRWLSLFAANRLTIEAGVEIRLDEIRHRYTVTDLRRDVEFAAGAGTDSIGVDYRSQWKRGTIRDYRAGAVVGLHDDGSAVRTYRFDSVELHEIIDPVLEGSGWGRGMSLETKLGLTGGILGGGIALAVLIALGVVALLGGFGG